MRKIFIVPALLLTAACSLTPAYRRPEVQIPAQWREEQAVVATDLTNWWQKFKSPELTALEEKALLQNLDLKAALDRVEQARAAEKVARSVFFPQADATADIGTNREKTGGHATTHRTSAGAGVDVNYELDLFGANRAAATVAEANVAGSLYDREALALVVSSDVAETYASALALMGRIHVAQQSHDNAEKTLKILTARFKAGATSALEVEQQKTELANADASIANLENNLTVTLDALAVLMGEVPQTFKIFADSLGDIAVPDITPGQPSSLLERRPDIRKAEADLVAANADIGVARAAFFPTVNLGLAASIIASPVSGPATSALDLAAGLSAPLFKGGSLQANLAKTKARQNELVENYRKTVLTAFAEVEDALAAIKSAEKRRKAYSRAVISAGKAYDLANLKFKAGAIDYITLLDSQRSLLSAKDSLVAVNLERMNAAVNLYKALGGGWQGHPEKKTRAPKLKKAEK
jgi:multidrug efflux system outer membrane protein